LDRDAVTTNFARAIQAVLDNLRCIKCGEANRPGVYPIKIENGIALCSTCSTSWTVNQGD